MPFDEKASEIDHVDLRTRVVLESAADDPGTTQLAVRIGGMVMTTDDCPSVRVAYRARFRLFVDGQWWSRWSRWVRCEGGADRIDACQYNLHALGLGAARTSFPAGQGPDPFVVEMDVGVRAFDAAMNVRHRQRPARAARTGLPVIGRHGGRHASVCQLGSSL